jgi:predicted O-methyltransferase YrrM
LQFDEIAERVQGIPFMEPALARRVYEHVRNSRPREVLELGTAHGVSAAYMAAALEANGQGQVTTVDHGGAATRYDPPAEVVLERAGLAHRVTIVRAHSSYNWFLKRQIESASDEHGNCEPTYDFVYLDGAHNFTVDGLAVVLIERLLRPGGWLLMDDLDWTYRDNPWFEPQQSPDGAPAPLAPLSEDERNAPQVRAVFETVLKQHPAFTRFADEDAWYLWAQKNPDAPRRYELTSSRPLSALLLNEMRRRRHARKTSARTK